MKKLMLCMMLATGITGTTIAQQKSSAAATNKVFEIPEGFLSYSYDVDLGSGNMMRIELTNNDDIQQLKNIDSLLASFLRDIAPFKDSLSDELNSKRIDYLTDAAGRKKIRISVFRPASSAYVIRQGEPSLLKVEQDTVNLIGMLNKPAKHTMHKAMSDISYYRISFFVNRLDDLRGYDGKALNDKLTAVIQSMNKRWKRKEDGSWYPLKGDETISAATPNGSIIGSGDMLSSLISVNAENYKNYFIPSISLGLTAIFNSGKVKRELGVAWEPKFIFSKNILTGKMETFRNNFITLSYSQKKAAVKSPYFTFNPNFSLSYLLKQKGDFFDKNTFRLGIGKFTFLKDHVSIEPGIYFNDFLKKVTPGIQVSIHL